ncbi:SDR family NAD(P)-dependent oxidoreductase [Nocardia sp. 2YAB30]|uniref:SDR family NAD(P)-dependent oxidoreductase n=1 Tax=unclassified Nocardia TaxID=2637762 RepID=UPI003F994D73
MTASARIPRAAGRESVLITGASSGIGSAFAQLLAENGHDLIVVARRAGRLTELAENLADTGAHIEILAADLQDRDDVRRVENRLSSRTEPVHHLLNNAGVTDYVRFADSDVDRAVAQMVLHAEVPMRLMRAALPQLISRGSGGVLNIASTAGLQATPGLAAYAASKAALVALSESIHHEVKPFGVQVSCVCPGYTRTELQEAAGVDASGLPRMSWMNAAAVAHAGWRGYQRGRALIIPGAVNRAAAAALRYAPRTTSRRVTANVVKKVRAAAADGDSSK